MFPGNGLLVQGLNLGNVAGPPALAAVVTAAGNWESAVGLITVAAASMTILSPGVGAIEHRQRKIVGAPIRFCAAARSCRREAAAAP